MKYETRAEDTAELSTGCYKGSEILPFRPPRSTWGRWAKISSPFTPQWITQEESQTDYKRDKNKHYGSSVSGIV
jgi:hypothetical protein